jgi:hypothetical protein
VSGPAAVAAPPARDEGFPRRVLRATLVLVAIGVVYACLLRAWTVAIGLGGGGVLGGAAFAVLAWTVGAVVGGTGRFRARKALVIAVAVVKLPLLGVAIWYLLARLDADPLALAAGLAMTQVVMVMKMAGRAVSARAGGGTPGSRTGTGRP